jgi:hypothetical protein
VNIGISAGTRTLFRDWLRTKLRTFDPPFYTAHGDHYLIREFRKYCEAAGHPIDETTLGRYLRDENPVLPMPDHCRELAAVFRIPAIEVMKQAGLVTDSDMVAPLS